MRGGQFLMGQRRSLGSALPYVWIASLGRMLANRGHDTRAVRIKSEPIDMHNIHANFVGPDRFEDFWR